jgi:hypothetical protein
MGPRVPAGLYRSSTSAEGIDLKKAELCDGVRCFCFITLLEATTKCPCKAISQDFQGQVSAGRKS